LLLLVSLITLWFPFMHALYINEIVALRGKMPQAVVGKKFGIEQTEVSAIQRLQRAKTAGLLDDHEKKNPVKRVKGVELIVPIAYGTISFWLGKKAEEYEIDPLPLIYMSL
jgi:hypothetical protein